MGAIAGGPAAGLTLGEAQPRAQQEPLAQAAAASVSTQPVPRVEQWKNGQSAIDKALQGRTRLAATRLVFVGDPITDFWLFDDNPWVSGQKYGPQRWNERFAGSTPMACTPTRRTTASGATACCPLWNPSEPRRQPPRLQAKPRRSLESEGLKKASAKPSEPARPRRLPTLGGAPARVKARHSAATASVTASASATLREQLTTTSQPSPAKRRTVAAPRPDDEPLPTHPLRSLMAALVVCSPC